MQKMAVCFQCQKGKHIYQVCLLIVCYLRFVSGNQPQWEVGKFGFFFFKKKVNNIKYIFNFSYLWVDNYLSFRCTNGGKRITAIVPGDTTYQHVFLTIES